LIALLAAGGSTSLPPVGANSAVIQQSAQAIPNERDRGIQLYKSGDAKGAVNALRVAVKQDKNDITAWHYLGLALELKGDKGGAKKAYEKGSRSGESLLDQQLDRTPKAGDIPRAMLAIRPQLIEAAESAERYMALDAKLSKSKLEDWTGRIESLRGFAEFAGDENLTLFSGKEVTTKARVLRKPEPQYTDAARKSQTTGTVVLRCIFGANGRVFGFHVVYGLPDGLTEMSIRAARQIKFIPATKDGRPVSMWMELQYNFNLY
jgi:Flp pilus assembly protein TadD